MRNKFSELVNNGVASFNYKPLAPEMPEADPICKAYNNIYSMALDTHMSMVDGVRVITGHNVADLKKWNEFCFSSKWGGYDFTTSGTGSLQNYLHSAGLCTRVGSLNNDIVCFVEPCQCEDELELRSTNESELNEAKSLTLNSFINFDSFSDVYNALSELGLKYEINNKKFEI